MKHFTYTYNNIKPAIDLSEFGSTDDLLFFDIETTGLSPATSFIYLIGAGYYTINGFIIEQWFAESLLEEVQILHDFFEFTSRFTSLIHFNGLMFDVPFIEKRSVKNNIPCKISEMNQYDIYKMIKPYKTILGLSDVRQKTIENFLHINRDDLYTGGELIPVYKKYNMYPDDSLLELLLLHNKEDVYNMTSLLSILNYRHISDISFHFESIKENNYKDYNGENKTEIIISGTHSFSCSESIKSIKNGIYLMINNDNKLTIRLPIIHSEMKHFFKDYKNYYYLPLEDCVIHKSIASGVPKENRKTANKNNCYIKSTGDFILFYDSDEITTFKTETKAKEFYCTYNDFKNLSNEQFSVFMHHLIQYFMK